MDQKIPIPIPRKKLETKIQSEIVQYVRNELKVPRGLFFSIPNDGQFKNVMIATGLVTGFPDLGWLIKGSITFFETKTPVGTLSPEQKLVHENLTEAGYQVFVVRSLEDFINLAASLNTP